MSIEHLVWHINVYIFVYFIFCYVNAQAPVQNGSVCTSYAMVLPMANDLSMLNLMNVYQTKAEMCVMMIQLKCANDKKCVQFSNNFPHRCDNISVNKKNSVHAAAVAATAMAKNVTRNESKWKRHADHLTCSHYELDSAFNKNTIRASTPD